MCNSSANAACNNATFTWAILPPMSNIHPTMARLYEAAIAGEIIKGKHPQAELARAMNTSSQRIKNWADRGVSKEGAIEALQDLGISLGWVMEGDQPMLISGVRRDAESAVTSVPLGETPPGYVRFQVMGEGGAGTGMMNSEHPEVLREIELAEWQVRGELGRLVSPSRVKLLTVRGDSMAPRIRSGDVVFVDIDDCCYDGDGNYVVILHGHALVKRLELRTTGLHIVSLADVTRPDIVTPGDMQSLHIAGRVLGAIQIRRSEEL